MTAPTLSALALVCSLKRRPAESSSELIAEQVCENLRVLGVGTETLRRLYRRHELLLVRITGLLFIGFAVNTLLHAWQGWQGARAAARA